MPPLEFKPKNVLVVMAHPDDIEYTCGGAVAKWQREGARISYVLATDGSKGTDDPNMDSKDLAMTREQEQLTAAEKLNVLAVEFLRYKDCELDYDEGLQCDIVKAIRNIKPDTVVTFDPTFYYSVEDSYINHRDHRIIGEITFDAVYPKARDHLSCPKHLSDLKPHKAANLLLINFDKPTHFVDISQTIDAKVEAMLEHKSQVKEASKMADHLRGNAKKAGSVAKVDSAEGFVYLKLPD